MLFLNTTVEVIAREFKFGIVEGISLGEHGRGRQQIFLPTPQGLEGAVGGLRTDLTIGLSKAGKPRINHGKDKDMYLALSTERGYTRRGNGVVKTPVGQTVELIARGNGADGDAGRIGYWDVILVKANEGDVFRVTWEALGTVMNLHSMWFITARSSRPTSRRSKTSMRVLVSTCHLVLLLKKGAW